MNHQPDTLLSPDPAIVLKVQNICKTYHQARSPAVDRFSFSIHFGEIFGLLGPNGSGKTTTIRMIIGLLTPDQGDIQFFFPSQYSMMIHPSKVKIGFVPQDFAFYPQLTVKENLLYFATLLDLPRHRLSEHIQEIGDLMELDLQNRSPASHYSGGLKRRLNLAIGLLGYPPLLLLDEPTVGLDTSSRSLILDRLRSCSQKGMSILYTTHYMEEVEKICHRICIIHHGRQLIEGTIPNILSQYPECHSLEAIFLKLTGHQWKED